MIRALLAGVCALGVATAACADSPWLPAAARTTYGVSLTYQSFDELWRGDELVDSPVGTVEQRTMLFDVEHGFGADLALDAQVGYVETRSDDGGESGITDSRVGVRWRFLDETRRPGVPTLTLRAGGTIAGSYDVGSVYAPGDGASSVELALLYGKAIGRGGVYGDVGYRSRFENVPDDVFGSVGGFVRARWATIALAYRHVEGQSGIDIGSPGFTPAQFPLTREIGQSVELVIGVDSASRWSTSLVVAHVLDGRNTAAETVAYLTTRLTY